MWPWLMAGVLTSGGGHGSDPDDPWRELDRAIGALAPAKDEGRLGPGVLLRPFYTSSAEEGGAGTEDLSGFVFEDLDFFLGYREGEVSWRLSADVDTGDVELEDAWGRWEPLDGLALTAGQFKPRVVRSASLPADGLLFRERTYLGAAFDGWDDGAELGGHYDQFDAWVAVTDGANGSRSDHFWSARAEWALYDQGFEDSEGARGAPLHLRVLLGATWFADTAQSSSAAAGWGGDVALTLGPFALHGEWLDLDEEFTRTIDVFNGHLVTIGDGKPRSATLSRRVTADGELALRYQNADDFDETEAFGVGANWSPGGGPARFVADLELVESDTRDFSLFSLGVVVGSSGLSRPFADVGPR